MNSYVKYVNNVWDVAQKVKLQGINCHQKHSTDVINLQDSFTNSYFNSKTHLVNLFQIDNFGQTFKNNTASLKLILFID